MRTTIIRKLARAAGSAILALAIVLSGAGAAFAEPGNGGYGWVYRNLEEVNNSGVSGTVAFGHKGDGTTTVKITLIAPTTAFTRQPSTTVSPAITWLIPRSC